jgi:ERCC4-type nuclease
MKIIVDEREIHVYNHLITLERIPSIQIEKEMLPLGDFLLTMDDDTPVLLYERKTFSDLFSSIKDGRYEEQSYRLLNDDRFSNKKDIIYLIEGMYSQITDKSEKKLLLSTITSLCFFKGFGVLRTNSVQDTSETILFMASKIQRDFDKGKVRHCNSTITEPSSYTSVVKKVKKDNITKDNIGEIMLCTIPGISSTVAGVIMSHVQKSLPRLIQLLEMNPEELEALKVGPSQRKISKKVIESMKSFLCDPLIRFSVLGHDHTQTADV